MIVWIASYPKSGNTFLRILLSNYLYQDNLSGNSFSAMDKIPLFPNLFLYNPLINNLGFTKENLRDNSNLIYQYSIYLQKTNFKNDIQILKTHSSCFKKNDYLFTDSSITACAIYLIRDPRNLVGSYADNMNASVDSIYKEMKMNFVQKQKDESDWYPISHFGTWRYNFESWKNASLNFPVKIVRYEDLVTKTNEVFLDIIMFLSKFIKIKINPKKISKIVEENTFEKIQSNEKKGLFKEMHNITKGNTFFQKGISRSWKDDIKNADIYEDMKNEYKDILENFNYL